MTAPSLRRISISLPSDLQEDFDELLKRRGFENRSQAIAELIRAEITDQLQEEDTRVMAGTISLFYDETQRGIQQQITNLQRRHVAEVIASHHVLLEHNHRMEILVVQGPVGTLRTIIDAFLALRGVKTGTLNLTPMILPPLHPKK